MKRGYNARRMKRLASYIWNKYKQPESKIHNENEVFLSLLYNNNIILSKNIKNIISNSVCKHFKVTTAWRSNKNLGNILRHFP